jgi:hypothetical protein
VQKAEGEVQQIVIWQRDAAPKPGQASSEFQQLPEPESKAKS